MEMDLTAYVEGRITKLVILKLNLKQKPLQTTSGSKVIKVTSLTTTYRIISFHPQISNQSLGRLPASGWINLHLNMSD